MAMMVMTKMIVARMNTPPPWILSTAGSSVHVQDVSRPLHGHTPIDFGKETGFGLPTTRAKNRNQNFGRKKTLVLF